MTTVAIAQGARTQLLLKKQTALGTVATGNFTVLPYTTHSLNVQIGGVEDPQIRSDREVADFRHGNRFASGDIVAPLIFGDHEVLMESAMFSAFDTDSVQIGTSPQYLSIEDGALDISEFRMFQDMLVNTWAVSMTADGDNAIIGQTFGLMGTNGAANTATTGGGTAVAQSNNQPFDSFNAAIFDNAAESGSELAELSALEFTLDNQISPAYAIGQQEAIALQYGRGRVTGQMTAYYKDETWLNRFLNETEFALVANVTDPDGNTYEFRFPAVKITGGDVPVANEQARLVTLPWVALYDASLGSAFQITKA